MKLIVDCGNSRLKWRLLDEGHLVGGGSLVHGRMPDPEAVARALKAVNRPTRVLVASVAGEPMDKVLGQVVEQLWGCRPEFVQTTASAAGVVNGYDEIARLGVDRWAALVAAWNLDTGPVCVVDCGTALTVDGVDAEGRFRGGVIAPGPQSMRRALYGATAGIPDEGSGAVSVFATNTRAGVTAGSLLAAAAFANRVLDEMTTVLGPNTRTVLTGGEAETLSPLIRFEHIVDADLVFKGIVLLAGAN